MEVDAARSPDQTQIQVLAASVMKTKVVFSSELNGYLHTIYKLSNTSGSSFCLLKYTARDSVRLLGIEEEHLAVEASVLALLGRRVEIAAPKLLEYQASVAPVGLSYIICGPYSGVIMSSSTRSLTESDRIEIDFSLGRYVKRLASMTSPTFGTFRRATESSWAVAFASLLEMVLASADGEHITLPYGKIRELVKKHEYSLDQVTEARLVLLEVKAGRNIVLDEHSKDVTSLVDYSSALWGDPFLSDAFQRPARGFLDGFGEGHTGKIDRRIRGLLYTAFHALLTIARCRYRSQLDGLDSQAMKSLLTTLRYLDEIDI